MSSDKSAGSRGLWWIAFAAQLIVITLELIERDYLKAASAFFLAVPFLMLATGITSDGREKPAWRKVLLFIMVAVAMGLLIYRIALGRLLMS